MQFELVFKSQLAMVSNIYIIIRNSYNIESRISWFSFSNTFLVQVFKSFIGLRSEDWKDQHITLTLLTLNHQNFRYQIISTSQETVLSVGFLFSGKCLPVLTSKFSLSLILPAAKSLFLQQFIIMRSSARYSFVFRFRSGV